MLGVSTNFWLRCSCSSLRFFSLSLSPCLFPLALQSSLIRAFHTFGTSIPSKDHNKFILAAVVGTTFASWGWVQMNVKDSKSASFRGPPFVSPVVPQAPPHGLLVVLTISLPCGAVMVSQTVLPPARQLRASAKSSPRTTRASTNWVAHVYVYVVHCMESCSMWEYPQTALYLCNKARTRWQPPCPRPDKGQVKGRVRFFLPHPGGTHASCVAITATRTYQP